MFGLQTGVGVKIPRPAKYPGRGILTPHLKAQQIPYDIKKLLQYFMLFFLIELIPLVGIKNFFHILGLESGMGVKIPQPGYLDPHQVICF